MLPSGLGLCERSFGCIVYVGVKFLVKANAVLSLERATWPRIFQI